MLEQEITMDKKDEVTLNDITFPVQIIDNPNITNFEYSKVVQGIVNGQMMDLNYCSGRYQLVNNRDIFPKIEDILLLHGIEFDVVYSHVNNARFYADYTINDKEFNYKMEGTEDTIKPLIRVQHSYNGLTKYRIIFGYFRMVCSNGLTIPVEEMKDFNLVIVGKHTKQILDSLEQLNTKLTFFAKNAKEITTRIAAKFEILRGRNVVNMEDRIVEVLEATKISVQNTTKFSTLNYITNVITEELKHPSMAGYNGQVNDFLIYNGINRYIFDNDLNIAATEKRMDKDLAVITYMLK
jgi:phage host-nuclease inhibitor protein Gam